ncbi:2-Methylisocitrate lyase, PEP mutase family [Natronincola peptidivorans]|uniref:2-Methylisocitrate lyase, PEP mutase family n=1 Tax=Natronincola peptidivorans TaxID=426128 RepID=A0A1I0H757_9FIRM|nr:isocitrate lyase/phosphoenolpyruvate mutase family protein [Natronincola peptidivorans]SET79475.1 2-Methylisocitrate lyase, PEP mutase family [Natronincola peptidivorans]
MNKYKALKKMIHDSETLIVPDAYDGISAKLIEYCGFKVIQCSGYSYSISKGLKDEKILTLDQNIRRTSEIVSAVDIPVMADGEDGYGCQEIFRNNIIKFIRTGIAGINIEDQNLWNPYNTEKIVSLEVMSDKIKEILKIKQEHNIKDFVVNARTDALRSTDNRKKALNIAIERGNKYLEFGADICFVPCVKTKEEIQLLQKEINGPISIAAGLPYNINEFTIRDCIELGISRVSLPCILIFSAMGAMKSTLDEIRNTSTFESTLMDKKLIDINLLQDLLK